MATPNMGLILPVPGQTQALGVAPVGASWMELQNGAMVTIDGHNHSSGFGAPVPSSGLNINADLPFNSKNVTQLRSARFAPIALASLGVSDIGALVVSGADLYYVDTSANVVRITSAGGVAGTPGSIGGLASPAAVTYTPASKLFAFTSSSGFVANMSCGPVAIGDATVNGGNAVTLSVPAGLSAGYSLRLPAALPAGPKILTVDGTGAIGDAYDVDNATLQVASNTLSVKALGIGAAQIANGAITTTQISATAGILGSQLAASAGILGSQLAATTVARTNLVAVGQQISASSGNFTTTSTSFVDVTNLSVTITTTGRPVVLKLIPDGAAAAYIAAGATSAANVAVYLALLRGASNIGQAQMNGQFSGAAVQGQSPGAFEMVDPVGAGTYTYKIQAAIVASPAVCYVQNCKLVAYEL